MVQVFIDNSGSTDRSKLYWDHVSEIVNKLPSDTKIYFWNHVCSPSGRDDALVQIHNKRGNGGTSPESLVDYLDITNDRIVVITDGQIGHSEVISCENKLEAKFQNVEKVPTIETHVINSIPDLSVVAPFIRWGEYQVLVNGELQNSGNSRMVYDLDSYTSVDRFNEDFPDLFATISGQNLGKGNPQLRIAVLNLQTRLMRQINNEESDIQLIQDINCLKLLADKYYLGNQSQRSVDLRLKIDKLLNICDSQGKYDIRLLNTSRAARAETVQPPPVDEYPNPDVEDLTIDCPITFNEDVPVIQFCQLDTPLLTGQEQQAIESLTNCPLYLIGYPELCQKICDSLEGLIGLDFARQVNRSAFSRRKIGCTIALSSNPDLIKTSNQSLIKWLTGGKSLGNPHLWVVALWYIIKHNSFYRHDDNIIQLLDTHIKFRIIHYPTYLGLSGLTNSPLIHVPINHAFAYVLTSWILYPNQPERDRLRTFMGPSFDILIAGCQLTGWDLDYPVLSNRIKELRLVNYLIRNIEDLENIRNKIQAQKQNYLIVDGELVLLDGELTGTPFPLEDKLSECVPEIVMTHIGNVKRNVSFGQALIPNNCPQTPIVVMNNYNPEENIGSKQESIPISPNTFRPYSKINGKKWEQCAEQKYGPLKGQLNLYRYYLMYIESQKAYPTNNQLILFCWKREQNKEKDPRRTLPTGIVDSVNQLMKSYQSIVDVTPVDVFIRTIRKSMSRDAREQYE